MSLVPRQVASSKMSLQSPTSPSFVNIRPLISQIQQSQQSVPIIEALLLVQQALDQLQRLMRGSEPEIAQISVPVAAIGDLFTSRLNVAGTDVLSSPDPGWTAATGTSTRGGFDTSSVLLPVLAQSVKALIDALLAQGIIKP